MPNKSRLIPVFVFSAVIAGCVTTQPPRVPPVTTEATGLSLTGKVVSHELATIDVEKSRAFYGELFGWEFETIPGKPRDYTVVRKDGKFIGGMFEFIREDGGHEKGEWIPMFSVPDVDSASDGIAPSGGAIVSGPRDLPDRGRLTLATDPQGAAFLLLSSNHGDPRDGDAEMNSWIWDELWTSDPDAALEFYDRMFAYESEVRDSTISHLYYLLSRDGQKRGGIMQLSNPEVRPHWVPFIRVENVAAIVDQAVKIGAQLIGEARQTAHGDLAALMLDATGAPIIVLEFQD